VEKKEEEQVYRVDVALSDGLPFSSRVVSDGTLRVLALLTMLHDPKHRGLLCFEEPENGVHPARLRVLIHRLIEVVTAPGSSEQETGEAEPLSQMLVNSHSPVVLSAMRDNKASNSTVFFADLTTVVDSQAGETRRRTRLRPVSLADQTELFEEDSQRVTRFEEDRYLFIRKGAGPPRSRPDRARTRQWKSPDGGRDPSP
jgi:predicted ATPase